MQDSNGVTIGGPRSYYELPADPAIPGYQARAAAPPTQFVMDFSNPLPLGDYSNKMQLVGSADTRAARPTATSVASARAGWVAVARPAGSTSTRTRRTRP